MNDPIRQIGYVGLGLIGGSIAKTIHQQHPELVQCAYFRQETPSDDLLLAREEGVITHLCPALDGIFAQCDLIFLCAPVLDNNRYLEQLRPLIKPSCILTDVGSVKGSIHQKAAELELESCFIGGHPMAGSEKTGYRNASVRLLENAYYMLTPTPSTPSRITDLMTELVKELGAIPVLLDYKEHDNITAAISHVPHVIASSLVNLVRDRDDERELLRNLAAGGFKDITRIASSSPEMWESICLSNRDSILSCLEDYISYLTRFREELAAGSGAAVYDMFSQSREYRDSIPNRSPGLVSRIFDLYVDIPDETGAIAILASMLAANAISIKNIGIIHNREFAGGVLRIELYDEDSRERTKGLLEAHHYTIYQR